MFNEPRAVDDLLEAESVTVNRDNAQQKHPASEPTEDGAIVALEPIAVARVCHAEERT